MRLFTKKAPVRGVRILVVEDDAGVSHALSLWLNHQNIRFAMASSAGEAKEILEDARFIEQDFDDLLVDYRLPDGSGYEVIKTYRTYCPSGNATIMTAFADDRLEAELERSEIPLLEKPLTSRKLTGWLMRISRCD